MTKFEAKVIQNVPANRLLALGGINSEDNQEEGWETIYLKPSELGWIPDVVTSEDLEEGSVLNVTIKNNPVWEVEASQDLPAGTLVMCDVDGRVRSYNPSLGNHIGYTTHSVKVGEVVEIVRKYGGMPQSQEEASTFIDPKEPDLEGLTNGELKSLLDNKGIEYNDKATKKELVELLGGE